MSREPLDKAVRFAVLKRDNFTCRYCGRSAPDVVLEVDHIISRAQGGSDDPSNLITSCLDCNAGKSAEGLDEEMQPLPPETAEEVEARTARVAAFHRAGRERDKVAKQHEEEIVAELAPVIGGPELLPMLEPKNIRSLAHLEKLLDLETLREVARYTEAKDLKDDGTWQRWLYFCRICWIKVKEKEAS